MSLVTLIAKWAFLRVTGLSLPKKKPLQGRGFGLLL
jgi:hypothetical protein